MYRESETEKSFDKNLEKLIWNKFTRNGIIYINIQQASRQQKSSTFFPNNQTKKTIVHKQLV